jgi:hypothetical protein
VAVTAYCSTCRKTVYVEAEDTLVCPVCSTPLLEVIEEPDGEGEGAAGVGDVQAEGRK